MKRVTQILIAILFATTARAEQAHVVCKGLPDATIAVTTDIDWAYGTIEYRGARAGIAWGTVSAEVPAKRRPGFRWMKTARFGEHDVAWGRYVAEKPHTYRATVDGCIYAFTNFVAPAGDEAARDRFVALIRAFAESGCDCRVIKDKQ